MNKAENGLTIQSDIKQKQEAATHDQAALAEKVATYINEATSENTRKAYKSDIKHFEQVWGGLLPASTSTVCKYLAAYAETLNVTTLARRLSAIATWHKAQGFPDPTNNELVRKVMQGIRKKHNQPADQARPLTIQELSLLDNFLQTKITEAAESGLVTAKSEKQWLKAHRDLAMVLIGFWRGFRADTVCSLKIEHIKPVQLHIEGAVVPGLRIFLPASKGDRQARGETFDIPSLPELCPVTAYNNWINAAGLMKQKGPVFRTFDRSGDLTNKAMAPGSVNHWMKRLCKSAGMADHEQFSSHSMRRGVATHLANMGADVAGLMKFIGWKSSDSAVKYIDQGQRINSLLLKS